MTSSTRRILGYQAKGELSSASRRLAGTDMSKRHMQLRPSSCKELGVALLGQTLPPEEITLSTGFHHFLFLLSPPRFVFLLCTKSPHPSSSFSFCFNALAKYNINSLSFTSISTLLLSNSSLTNLTDLPIFKLWYKAQWTNDFQDTHHES